MHGINVVILYPIHDTVSISAVQKSISILLSLIKEFTPCNHVNGWKLQNFHEHLHIPVDIYMFGSPQNYNNSPTEHGLIETDKQPADHAQKSNTQFVSQVTKRVLGSTFTKKAKQALMRLCSVELEEKPPIDFSNLPNSASFHVSFNDNGVCVTKWLGKKYLQESVHVDSALLSWIHR